MTKNISTANTPRYGRCICQYITIKYSCYTIIQNLNVELIFVDYNWEIFNTWQIYIILNRQLLRSKYEYDLLDCKNFPAKNQKESRYRPVLAGKYGGLLRKKSIRTQLLTEAPRKWTFKLKLIFEQVSLDRTDVLKISTFTEFAWVASALLVSTSCLLSRQQQSSLAATACSDTACSTLSHHFIFQKLYSYPSCQHSRAAAER